MTHQVAGRSPKTLVESALCFAFTGAALTATALVIKWLFQLI